MVETIFSHMRELEGDSKTTRAGLMEAVIMNKLEGISISAPPQFLPAHITAESALREEGRDAEAGYGSRAKRGAALLRRAIENAGAAELRGKEKKARQQSKVAAAEGSQGGKVFEVDMEGEKTVRALAAGERLKPRHFRKMGQFITEWMDLIKENEKTLGWTTKIIENQIVLINSHKPKSKALTRACKNATGLQGAKGKPIFKDASSRIPETAGDRATKLPRVLAFVHAEGTVEDRDHGDASEVWELAIEKDPVAGQPGGLESSRRHGSQAVVEGHSSQGASQTTAEEKEQAVAALLRE